MVSMGSPVSAINKTDRHDKDIIEILLKVALNTIRKPNKPMHKTLHLELAEY